MQWTVYAMDCVCNGWMNSSEKVWDNEGIVGKGIVLSVYCLYIVCILAYVSPVYHLYIACISPMYRLYIALYIALYNKDTTTTDRVY